MFDPKTNKFPYPMDTDTHYLRVKKIMETYMIQKRQEEELTITLIPME